MNKSIKELKQKNKNDISVNKKDGVALPNPQLSSMTIKKEENVNSFTGSLLNGNFTNVTELKLTCSSLTLLRNALNALTGVSLLALKSIHIHCTIINRSFTLGNFPIPKNCFDDLFKYNNFPKLQTIQIIGYHSQLL